jgi:citrate lyase gamma subunit
MNKKVRKSQALIQPFQTGQIWQMEDSHVQIGLVGKTLVHYKLYKGQVKRSSVSLLNKDALEKFLRSQQAVLVSRQTTLTPA